ncbi:hypothetical protein HOLleu_43144 [Holothuria leucospilota]|uniref:Uncharacterized protein n=1 Tax=Holothuria leucospilota TaxID=206669 RepID=A0A9Q1B945_HOLLE|nr:hypothetical protein HOLleu_43144 [Holothuria leucospilota]
MMLAKWLSVANHTQDIHDHETEIFPRCLHGPLGDSGRKKKWLKPSTEVCEKVVDVITNKVLQKDIQQLSPSHQTSNVEGFHSVVIHFAPKSTHFSYRTMISRLQLAALHYNENASRPQAVTREGQERYNLKFPKYKKGQATVSKVLTNATYAYVDELMDVLIEVCRSGEDPKAGCDVDNEPPPLASAYFHPDKEEAVQQHQSRFNPT